MVVGTVVVGVLHCVRAKLRIEISTHSQDIVGRNGAYCAGEGCIEVYRCRTVAADYSEIRFSVYMKQDDAAVNFLHRC